MRNTTKAVLIVAGGTALAAAGIILALRPDWITRVGQGPRRTPGDGQSDPLASAPATPPVRAPVQFTRDGVPGAIAEALEHVVRKGNAQAAVWPLRRPRCFCVMVDGKERLYELDRGMKAEHFEGLAECGFRPLPSEMRRTTSTYRAVTKAAVPDFNENADRILVLLCPRDDWPKVSLRWPPLVLKTK